MRKGNKEVMRKVNKATKHKDIKKKQHRTCAKSGGPVSYFEVCVNHTLLLTLSWLSIESVRKEPLDNVLSTYPTSTGFLTS